MHAALMVFREEIPSFCHASLVLDLLNVLLGKHPRDSLLIFLSQPHSRSSQHGHALSLTRYVVIKMTGSILRGYSGCELDHILHTKQYNTACTQCYTAVLTRCDLGLPATADYITAIWWATARPHEILPGHYL